jgi:hypothetical protein
MVKHRGQLNGAKWSRRPNSKTRFFGGGGASSQSNEAYGFQYAEKIRPNGRVYHNFGLSQDQLRMHQFLKKIGLDVEIHWVD